MDPQEDPSIEDEEMEEQGRQPSPHAAGSRGRAAPEEVQSRLRDISRTELEEHFHMSIETAATKLGIGLTTLKKLCRHYGIGRWPYRKVQQIVRLGRMFNAGLSQGRDYVFLVELLMELNLPADSKLWDNVDSKAAHQIRTIIRDVLHRPTAALAPPPPLPHGGGGGMAPPPGARGGTPPEQQTGGNADAQQLQQLMQMLTGNMPRPPLAHAIPPTPAYRAEQRSVDPLLGRGGQYAGGPPSALEYQARPPVQQEPLEALRAMLEAHQGTPWLSSGPTAGHPGGWRRGSVGAEPSREMLSQQHSQQSSQWMGMLPGGHAYSADPHMAVAREAARYAPPPADTISGSGSSTTVEQALAMLQQALQQQGSGGTVTGGAGGATRQTSLRSVFEHQQQVLRDREEQALSSLGMVFPTPSPSMPQRPSSPRYGGSLPTNFFRPPPPRVGSGGARESSSDLFDLLQGMLRTQDARGSGGGSAQASLPPRYLPQLPLSAMSQPPSARSSASYPPPTTYRTMQIPPHTAPPLFAAPPPVEGVPVNRPPPAPPPAAAPPPIAPPPAAATTRPMPPLPPIDEAVLVELKTVAERHPEVLLYLLRNSLLGGGAGGAPAGEVPGGTAPATGSPTVGESGAPFAGVGQPGGGGDQAPPPAAAVQEGRKESSSRPSSSPSRPLSPSNRPSSPAHSPSSPPYRPEEDLKKGSGAAAGGVEASGAQLGPLRGVKRPPSAMDP